MNTKERIQLEAALLFRKYGYPSTSMRDIAEAVGLEPSSLYNHIRSKEDLLRKICMDTGQLFLQGVDKILAMDLTAEKKLEHIIRLHFDIAVNQPGSVTVFDEEWRHLNEPFLSDFKDMRSMYEARLRTVVENGISRGEFRQVKSSIAVNSIISSLKWIHFAQAENKIPIGKQLEKEIIGFIFHGIAKNTN